MGMKAVTGTMRSTGNITTTKACLAALLAVLTLSACATSKRAGDLITPLSKFEMSSGFGMRAPGRPHYGIDLRARKGTPIYASGNGRVTFAGRQRGFGRVVIIEHGGGVETFYAHMSGFAVREGKKVKQGQKIGYVGKSGNATGYHLHFEVRERGTPVDPLLRLSDMPRR